VDIRAIKQSKQNLLVHTCCAGDEVPDDRADPVIFSGAAALTWAVQRPVPPADPLFGH
jgi:hypothetical protein